MNSNSAPTRLTSSLNYGETNMDFGESHAWVKNLAQSYSTSVSYF